MNARNEAKLSMYNAVLTHAEDNAVITATVPAFATQVTALRTIYSNIVTAAQNEAQAITGIAMDKTQLRKSLTDQAIQIAAAVFSFAASTNNNALKEQVKFTNTDFKSMRDEMIVPNCNIINTAATANLVALATYGITNTILNNFQDAMEDYANAIALPRNAVTQRSSYTATIKNLFKDGDSLLKLQMDKLALQFKTANLEFYNTYKSNRIILDAATSSTQATGTITDSVTNDPIPNVTINVVDQPYTTTSDATGKYTIKIPVPGTYNLSYSTVAGYNNKIQTGVVVTLGQSTTLNMQLIPLPV